MTPDHAAIRAFLPAWFDATTRGDESTIRSMMADDVLFLTINGPPMDREAFLTAFLVNKETVRISCEGEYAEVEVSGDLAFTRAVLVVTVTPLAGGKAMTLAGDALSVFRKCDGRWLLARDANFLKPR